MSKPATLAPPSSVAASTRPISPVQVSIGEPLNGAVRRLSSSIATTTAGEAAGSCLRPNTSQRSAVRDVDGEPADRSGRREKPKPPRRPARWRRPPSCRACCA